MPYGQFFAIVTHKKIIEWKLNKPQNDRLIGCFDKIKQMFILSRSLSYEAHAENFIIYWFFHFNDLSPVRCNVRYAVKESIHIKKTTKNINEKQNESIFLPAFAFFSRLVIISNRVIFLSVYLQLQHQYIQT